MVKVAEIKIKIEFVMHEGRTVQDEVRDINEIGLQDWLSCVDEESIAIESNREWEEEE
jgi:hypothetical protein